MRKIEFRGKVIDTKDGYFPDWYYGYYLIDLEGDRVRDFIYNCPTRLEVYPETVGQFTGLKNKNGTEIYEGDVIKCLSYYTDTEYVLKIVYDSDTASFLGCWEYKDIYLHYLEDFEVIGNIHDNPELLTLNH